MGWSKREVSANLVILGDAEGQVTKVGGLLAGVVPDPRYPDNRRYELVQKDATSKVVAGSASINSQLGPADVGKFVKLTFEGWGKSANGRFKEITVEVYEGEATGEMKSWPRFAELQDGHRSKKAASAVPDPEPPDEDETDDDLPFDRGLTPFYITGSVLQEESDETVLQVRGN